MTIGEKAPTSVSPAAVRPAGCPAFANAPADARVGQPAHPPVRADEFDLQIGGIRMAGCKHDFNPLDAVRAVGIRRVAAVKAQRIGLPEEGVAGVRQGDARRAGFFAGSGCGARPHRCADRRLERERPLDRGGRIDHAEAEASAETLPDRLSPHPLHRPSVDGGGCP
ncbi:MAG: hypothetical protein EBT33_00255 [Betaproteobacteria bacterium]|nr:hypothetical protein [Betaproteobacteria bacterium]